MDKHQEQQPMQRLTSADLLSESDRVLQDVVQYLRNPDNFGENLSMAADDMRLHMLGKLNFQLARNRAAVWPVAQPTQEGL